jgi:asparagine synthase (glutamine-hydrolysing)
MVPGEYAKVDEQSVFNFANWLRRDFLDRTFYQNIKTFPRASFAWVDDDGGFEPQCYWSIPRKRMRENDIGIAEASTRFNELIEDAVRLRLRADVPVGSQLSGGLDSSTLLAVACGIRDRIDVYTVKFNERGSAEEPFARLLAEQYRTQVKYHVIEPPAAELIDDIDAYSALMDEPFHSPVQYTSHCVWKAMSNAGLRVVLYGAGGDELFAGYGTDYFPPFLRLLLRRRQFVRFTREFLSFSEYMWNRHVLNYGYMLAKLIPHLPYRTNAGLIRFIPARLNPLLISPEKVDNQCPPLGFNERLIAYMEDWLMNYWLRVDNQNSMGVPVELRSPFLDHRLVEFAFQLPERYLIRNGWLKWIVRHAMQDRLPQKITWRRQKMGFPFPLKSWLAAHKVYFVQHLKHVDCPYVDTRRLMKNYSELVSKHSAFTWGILSILLWWKNANQIRSH